MLLAATAAAGRNGNGAPTNSPPERTPDVTAAVTNETHLYGTAVKPLAFATYRERLDFIHRNMEPTLRTVVILADDLFRDESVWLDPPDCRFRLSFESETRGGADPPEFTFEPNFDADIRLPQLEHRWKVYFRSRSRDTITDREEETGGRATRLGISQFVTDRIRSDVGVRLRVRPEAYARLQWDRYWAPRYYVIRPAERLFYETDKGLGELTSLTVHRWIGRKPRVFVQSVSQLEYSETSEGLEFEQAFRFGRLKEALEPMETYTQVLGDRDIARGQVFRLGLHGHSDDATVVDGYRFGFLNRNPLYKKWMYLSFNPELLWERDKEWKTEYRLRLSVDMLFWGSVER